ncbi:hypothetical protein BCR42DRAFT_420227 [Absidia repens]|uniref:F-box domain-containing protein n=1 Tax=Absidia repens TaxID=90262 RepID=A0A1X2I9A2_9FUNG|nr:hypothetical protein BCR42DRAFT_420227 [Absidia repens]
MESQQKIERGKKRASDQEGSRNKKSSKNKARTSFASGTTVLSLPLNIWLIILKHLPLRHVLTLAQVSREFSTHIFDMPEFWIHVQSLARANNDVPSPKLPLAFQGLKCRQLVVNYMNTICDYCYTGTNYSVESDGYKAVLPVRISQDKKDSGSIRRRRYSVYLCGTCRILHFQQHPEPVYVDTRTVNLSRDEVANKYHLPRKDITYIFAKDNNINRRSDTYIRFFARATYGGDVGIDAEKQRAKSTTDRRKKKKQ